MEEPPHSSAEEQLTNTGSLSRCPCFSRNAPSPSRMLISNGHTDTSVLWKSKYLLQASSDKPQPSVFARMKDLPRHPGGHSLVRDHRLKGDLHRLMSKGWEVTASFFLGGF